MNGNWKKTAVAAHAGLILATFAIVLGARPVGAEPENPAPSSVPVSSVSLVGSWVSDPRDPVIVGMTVLNSGDATLDTSGETQMVEDFDFTDGIVSFFIPEIPSIEDFGEFQGRIADDGSSIEGQLFLMGSRTTVPLKFIRFGTNTPPAKAPGGSVSCEPVPPQELLVGLIP